MKARLVIGAVGLGMGLFGLLRFLQREGGIVDSLLWLVGGVIVHDAVLAPLTIAASVLAARLVPRRAWSALAVGVVVLVTVTVAAVPVLGSFGSRPDNPTLLDRDYLTGWLVFVALVVLGVLVGLSPLGRRGGQGGRGATGRRGAPEDPPEEA